MMRGRGTRWAVAYVPVRRSLALPTSRTGEAETGGGGGEEEESSPQCRQRG